MTSGKGKTIETVKKTKQLTKGREKEKNEWLEHRGFFRAGNCSV